MTYYRLAINGILMRKKRHILHILRASVVFFAKWGEKGGGGGVVD
jgi:hypothetical protein